MFPGKTIVETSGTVVHLKGMDMSMQGMRLASLQLRAPYELSSEKGRYVSGIRREIADLRIVSSCMMTPNLLGASIGSTTRGVDMGLRVCSRTILLAFCAISFRSMDIVTLKVDVCIAISKTKEEMMN